MKKYLFCLMFMIALLCTSCDGIYEVAVAEPVYSYHTYPYYYYPYSNYHYHQSRPIVIGRTNVTRRPHHNVDRHPTGHHNVGNHNHGMHNGGNHNRGNSNHNGKHGKH